MALQEPPGLDLSLNQFRLALQNGGLHGALAFLNSRTSFRYTAVYRLDGQMMRNICLYDRRGEDALALSEIPLGDSFCQFVMRDNGFSTADSSQDERLLGHPYRGILHAYYGLPLSRHMGTLYGTFCHFDPEPMLLPDSEIALLESVSPLLMDQFD
jgi:hypothetical protein